MNTDILILITITILQQKYEYYLPWQNFSWEILKHKLFDKDQDLSLSWTVWLCDQTNKPYGFYHAHLSWQELESRKRQILHCVAGQP